MAHGKAKDALSTSELHIERLESYLRETGLIIQKLEEQKPAAGDEFMHEKRLSEAKREHIQLQSELSVAHAKQARLPRNKQILRSA